MAEKIPFVRGDQVRVVAGKDRERLSKGIKKRGEVNEVFPETGRVIVSQINMVKRHLRPNPQKGQQGGIVDQEAPIHHSNLQLICPSCQKPTRIQYRRTEKVDDTGKKSTDRVRICKLCGAGLGRIKEMSEPTNLEKQYREVAIPELMKAFGYKNRMEVPRLDKAVLSMGIGEGGRDAKLMEALTENFAEIAGQKPVVTKARKSIANFKVRAGMPVGMMVTLRRRRLYFFVERLFHAAIPRIRDFRGLSPRSFDGRGNYSLGLTEQLVFPEISYDSIPRVQGMNITLCTTAKSDDEARELLRLLGAPLAR